MEWRMISGHVALVAALKTVVLRNDMVSFHGSILCNFSLWDLLSFRLGFSRKFFSSDVYFGKCCAIYLCVGYNRI